MAMHFGRSLQSRNCDLQDVEQKQWSNMKKSDFPVPILWAQ